MDWDALLFNWIDISGSKKDSLIFHEVESNIAFGADLKTQEVYLNATCDKWNLYLGQMHIDEEKEYNMTFEVPRSKLKFVPTSENATEYTERLGIK